MVALVVVPGCSLLGGRGDVDRALRDRRLMVPVAGVTPAEVPDTFQAPRDGGKRVHGAVDILAPRGTPIVSADDGRVLRLKRNRLGGLTIWAADPSGRVVYYYAHLDRYRSGLAAGGRLRRGEVIGYVGTTGNADRREPHLHFQVLVDGRPVDPRPYFASAGRES